VLQVSKAAEVLGWRPEVTIEDGLAETFRFFADRHAREAGSAQTPAQPA
jgi:nucleoside-diphosphate-sugar epimerase